MSQRRQRVRRLALEEHGETADTTTEAPKPVKRTRARKTKKLAYASRAQRRHQNKTTDLLPKRRIPIAITVVLLAVSIGALNLLASLQISWSELLGSSNALSLSGAGTLSGWFSSFLLILSGLASLQIYALRQHRNDDYRGTYRVWLWMAAIFVLASVNSVVNFGQFFTALTGSLMEVSATSPHRMFWWVLAAKLLALTGLVVRGIFEVRASKGALVMVVLVWLAYAGSIVIQVPPAKEAIVSNYETVHGNCLLVGTALSLMFVLVYARYVYLSANGLLKVKKVTKANVGKVAKSKPAKSKPAKSKPAVQKKAGVKKAAEPTKKATPVRLAKDTVAEQSEAESQSVPAKQAAVEPPKSKPSSPLAAKMRSMKKNESTEEEAEIISLMDKQNLSKADKRRLKKLEKRVEQRRAA